MDKKDEKRFAQPLNKVDEQSIVEQVAEENVMRFAVVVHHNLKGGAAASAAATVIGGLRCEGFESPILDADGHAHTAIQWNLVVLKAKTGGQLKKLLVAAKAESVQAVAFTRFGQELSNSFSLYKEKIAQRHTEELDVIAVGLFGTDSEVRSLTRPFSLLR